MPSQAKPPSSSSCISTTEEDKEDDITEDNKDDLTKDNGVDEVDEREDRGIAVIRKKRSPPGKLKKGEGLKATVCS